VAIDLYPTHRSGVLGAGGFLHGRPHGRLHPPHRHGHGVDGADIRVHGQIDLKIENKREQGNMSDRCFDDSRWRIRPAGQWHGIPKQTTTQKDQGEKIRGVGEGKLQLGF